MPLSLRTVIGLCFLLFGVFQSPTAAASVELVGLVIDAKQEPIPNVRVELIGVDSARTSTTGEFIITFPESRIGTRGQLQVLKAGLRAKDQESLSLTLPRDSAQSPIVIEMVPSSAGATSPPAPARKIDTPIRAATGGECLAMTSPVKS